MIDIKRVRRSTLESFGVISLIGDLFLLNGLYLLAMYMRYGEILDVQIQDFKTMLVITNVIWFSMMVYRKNYILSRNKTIEKIIGKHLKYVIYLVILGFSVSEILQFQNISRLVHVYFFGMFIVAVFLFRLITIKTIKGRRRVGVQTRKVVIVGGNITTKSVAMQLKMDRGSGYEIVGVFNDLHENLEWDNELVKWSGLRADLIPFLRSNWVDEIYIPISEVHDNEFVELRDLCEKLLIRMKMIPNLNKFTENRKIGIEFLGNIPIFGFIRSPLEYSFNRFWKRSFDIIVSVLTILLIVSWVFPIVMIIMKITTPGPIFFKQERSGLNNRTFIIYKFRSMRVNRFSDKKQAKRNDPRLTRFGKFMRKSNIDELPQVFNVLKGDMSIVGPRPHMLRHTEQYSQLIEDYAERHYILPGITGWAQVNGFRGETPHLFQMKQRVDHDLWYAHNWSLLLDFRIIFLTFKNFIFGDKNAH